jgi:hypothetical protein
MILGARVCDLGLEDVCVRDKFGAATESEVSVNRARMRYFWWRIELVSFPPEDNTKVKDGAPIWLEAFTDGEVDRPLRPRLVYRCSLDGNSASTTQVSLDCRTGEE